MTTSTPTRGSKVGRARRSPGQLWQVPAFLLGLVALIGVASSAPWRPTQQGRELQGLMTALRRGLERHEPADVLVAQAESLRLRMAALPERTAEAHFLIGSAYFRQAEQAPQKDAWAQAAEQLEKALAADLEEADQDPAKYRLGVSLWQQNKEVARALDLMATALDKGAEQPLQAYKLLVQAYLKQTPPNLEGALNANRRLLDLTPERDAEAIAHVRLQNGEIFFRKELRVDALRELDRIGPQISRPIRLKARLLQALCCEEDALWSKAASIWQELLADAGNIEGGRARILFEIGWCQRQVVPPNLEETVRVWSESLQLGGPAGQAAGLWLGELRLALDPPQELQALADWKAALEKVRSPEDFRNPYVELPQVQAWFDKALDRFLDKQDTTKMQVVAELNGKITLPGVAELKIAKAADASARAGEEKLKFGVDNLTFQEVQTQFRRAGEAYERAAKVAPEAERLPALWRGVQCFLAAKESEPALILLQQFLKLEKDETHLAEGWLTLGNLYKTQGKREWTALAYKKCIEYPNTPFAVRARYFLAVEQIEQRNFQDALEILNQALRDPSPNPDRALEEKVLFQMAWLLVDMKLYHQARTYLKDCLKLYPESPKALEARENLGDCYRHLADKEKTSLEELQKRLAAGVPAESRMAMEEDARHHYQQRLEWLNEAIATYQRSADELERSARSKPLEPREEIRWRRALFRIGECQLDRGDLAEAIRVYQGLQAKHRRTVEGLLASRSICHILETMPAQDAARYREVALESLRQQMEDVQALPPDHAVFQIRRSPDGPVETQADWLRAADTIRRKLGGT